MRFKLFAATALASTVIIGMCAGPATAAPRTVDLDLGSAVVRVSPADQIGTLGDLGGVTQAVNKLVELGSPAKGAPDADAVKKQRADVQKATDALLKRTKGGGGLLAAHAHSPRILDVKDAVEKVRKDADALVKQATSGKPDPNAIADAVKALATDLLGLVTAVATSLGGSALPTKGNPITG